MANFLRRHLHSTRKNLWKGKPMIELTSSLPRTGGRNNLGRMTARKVGPGAQKRRYRWVDFHRNNEGSVAKVVRLEYDPNRTAYIALLQYEDDTFSYMIAPEGLKAGDSVREGPASVRNIGDTMKISDIPVGQMIHNVELYPGDGGRMARAAGTFVRLCGKEGGFGILQLPSGERRMVSDQCRATIGVVSNEAHRHDTLGKAGTNRRKGVRPIVRGIARNPVDHPMGGRTNSKHPRSPTGKYAKGGFTRKKNKSSDKMILKRSGSSKYKSPMGK
jgi:large subunit ribosomal protein L2